MAYSILDCPIKYWFFNHNTQPVFVEGFEVKREQEENLKRYFGVATVRLTISENINIDPTYEQLQLAEMFEIMQNYPANPTILFYNPFKIKATIFRIPIKQDYLEAYNQWRQFLDDFSRQDCFYIPDQLQPGCIEYDFIQPLYCPYYSYCFNDSSVKDVTATHLSKLYSSIKKQQNQLYWVLQSIKQRMSETDKKEEIKKIKVPIKRELWIKR
ncbi:MAG: hypothetical protein ACP5JP_07610 [bacterium]